MASIGAGGNSELWFVRFLDNVAKIMWIRSLARRGIRAPSFRRALVVVHGGLSQARQRGSPVSGRERTGREADGVIAQVLQRGDRLPARLLRADFPEAFSHHAHAFMVFGVRLLPNTRPAA